MADGAPANPTARPARLTDFLDVATLQDIQDGFAAVAGVRAVITDADGTRLTSPELTPRFLAAQNALAQQEEQVPEYQRVGREYVAPISVDGQRLGSVRMRIVGESALSDEQATRLGRRFGLAGEQVRGLLGLAARDRKARPAAVQFLFLLANAIARLCYQEYQLRLHVRELQVLTSVATALAEARDLQTLLDNTTRTVARALGFKAASVRLLDPDAGELTMASVFNLSPEYHTQGRLRFDDSPVDVAALGPDGYDLVPDVATDERLTFASDAARDGIVTMLSVGMRSAGEAVGVLRLYAAEPRTFEPAELDLFKAVAAAAAAAIRNARLADEQGRTQQLKQQVAMAADVQQRMIPRDPPTVPGLDLAAAYVPCFTLGGDLYDFIPLPYGNLGAVVADVSGKGVPASLIMASVRAALRAQIDNVYFLGEVVRRMNLMLVRDTKPSEFVTLWYGVFDAPNKRLTYCNAGHNPALLLRAGAVSELGAGDYGNMVLGVDEDERYAQHYVELRPGDTVLIYTDGLPDAVNFGGERYGAARIVESLKKGGDTARQVADTVLWDLRRFTGLAQAPDDVTIVAARVA